MKDFGRQFKRLSHYPGLGHHKICNNCVTILMITEKYALLPRRGRQP